MSETGSTGTTGAQSPQSELIDVLIRGLETIRDRQTAPGDGTSDLVICPLFYINTAEK